MCAQCWVWPTRRRACRDVRFWHLADIALNSCHRRAPDRAAPKTWHSLPPAAEGIFENFRLVGTLRPSVATAEPRHVAKCEKDLRDHSTPLLC